MQSNNRVLDDMARVAGGAVGALAGIRREIEAQVRHQLERLMAGADMVTRDEFEAVRAMAEKARMEQEDLKEKVAALEAALAAKAEPERPRKAAAKSRKPKTA
jgi:BMFP domain-containing protein YqiC